MKFNPKPDITAYELALILRSLFRIWVGRAFDNIIPHKDWPDSIKRHFDDSTRT